MSAEVRSLRGVMPPNTNLPVIGVVEKLQELLERAERGDVVAFAYVVVNGAGRPSTSWVSGTVLSETLVAGSALLAHRIVKAADEDVE